MCRGSHNTCGPSTVSNSVQAQAVALAGGEDVNGLELLRRLLIDYEGGAEQVALAGLRRFHAFPV